MQSLTRRFREAHRLLDRTRDAELIRACRVARKRGLTGHAAVEFARAERMPVTRRNFTAEQPVEVPPADDSSPRTAAEEPGPLVRTGQGDFTRDYTPSIRSDGRKRASIYLTLFVVTMALIWKYATRGA